MEHDGLLCHDRHFILVSIIIAFQKPILRFFYITPYTCRLVTKAGIICHRRRFIAHISSSSHPRPGCAMSIMSGGFDLQLEKETCFEKHCIHIDPTLNITAWTSGITLPEVYAVPARFNQCNKQIDNVRDFQKLEAAPNTVDVMRNVVPDWV